MHGVVFFRRDKRDRPAAGAQAGSANVPDTMPADELERVVRELAQVVAESMNEVQIERDTLELLQIGLPYLVQRECSDEAVVAGQTAARLGYLTRAAEFAMFEADLEPDPDLLATLEARLDEAQAEGTPSGDAMADLAAAMVAGEVLDPPPAEGSPSWTLPGLGGDARGRLRDELVSRMQGPADIVADDLRRTWKYGYFLCALDELCED